MAAQTLASREAKRERERQSFVAPQGNGNKMAFTLLVTFILFISGWQALRASQVKLGWIPARDAFDLAPLVGKHNRKYRNYTVSLMQRLDGHNDFPIWIRAFYQNRIYQSNFTGQQRLYGQVDFPRLRQGRLSGQFWSVYVEW